MKAVVIPPDKGAAVRGQPSLGRRSSNHRWCFGQEGVESLAIDLVLDLLGADEDGEADAGEDARLSLVNADVILAVE